jgi:hypothetical protein
MTKKTTTTISALALLLATSAGASTTDEFRWSGPVAAGKTVEIRNINGAIHAEASTNGALEVVAIKSSRHQDPSAVKIQVFEAKDGTLTFCTLYPSRAGSPENTCDERGTTNHGSTSDVEVDYRVRVPKGVTFEARTVNGDVKAVALKGPVDAKTVNGEIRVTTSSWAKAATVNGSVAVEMAGKDWPEDLEFKSVNGSIVLDLTEAPNAALRAETMHGAIDSEFPLEVSGTIRRNKLVGTLGAGGKELALATLNGSIELRRAVR